jgi:hypothetical protein
MFEAAHAAGQKVLLTFGAVNNNRENGNLLPPSSTDWERDVEVGGQTYTLNADSAVTMPWSMDHVDRSLDSCDFPARSGGRPINHEWSVENDWHLDVLDVSSGYKRAQLREIAKQTGYLLSALSSCLPSGVTETQILEAIELFNEVEVCSRYEATTGSYPAYQLVIEPFESGWRWGQACLHAAYGLRMGLNTQCADVKIRLPGIRSYSEELNHTWEDRILSLQGLVGGFVREAIEYLHSSRNGPQWATEEVLAALPTLMQGIDYHWFHAGELNADDHIRHIGYLVCEVAEIERTIVEEANARWQMTTGRTDETVLSSYSVSVMETGTSAIQTSLFVPTGLSGLPVTGSGDPASPREVFQAWEVVRRLGGALASGARMVGWHSWMSRSTAANAGFGLREDGQSEDQAATEATQRASWFVFQRLTSLLSGALFGRMVIPEV